MINTRNYSSNTYVKIINDNNNNYIINLEPQHGCVSFVTSVAVTRSVHPIRNRSRNKHWSLWVVRYASSWWPSENSFHICYTYFVSWIYPKSFYWIMRNTASNSAAYCVYKLLCKSEYTTSLCFLIIRIWNSISAFNPLGWLFPLNYELKLPTSGSPIIHLPVIFLLYDIGLNLFHWDSSVSKLYILNYRIFYRDVPASATHCFYGAWCGGLTTYLLFVSEHFANLVLTNSLSVCLT